VSVRAACGTAHCSGLQSPVDDVDCVSPTDDVIRPTRQSVIVSHRSPRLLQPLPDARHLNADHLTNCESRNTNSTSLNSCRRDAEECSCQRGAVAVLGFQGQTGLHAERASVEEAR